MSTIYVLDDLNKRTKKVQDNERFMVKINGNSLKAITLRRDQIEKKKANIIDDLQIRMYELMIREKTLSDLYDEIIGDKNMKDDKTDPVIV